MGTSLGLDPQRRLAFKNQKACLSGTRNSASGVFLGSALRISEMGVSFLLASFKTSQKGADFVHSLSSWTSINFIVLDLFGGNRKGQFTQEVRKGVSSKMVCVLLVLLLDQPTGGSPKKRHTQRAFPGHRVFEVPEPK